MKHAYNWMLSASVFGLVVTPAVAQLSSPSQPSVEVTAPVPSAEPSPDTGEIVVTANKRAQLLTDVGLSVAVIDSSALQTRNVTSVEDLGNVVPGLTVGQSGYSTPIYSLRGVGNNEPTIGAGSSVTVYVDEVPLTLPVMTRGATLDLERVEVLKGPQGTLYGQNSTGGTINYIAAKPTDDFRAGINGSYGRFNAAALEAFVSGPLSETLKGRVAVRADRQFDGWQKSFSRPGDRLGKTKKFAARAILAWEPSSDFRLTLNGNGWIDKSDSLAPQLYQVVGQSGTGAGNILNEVLSAPAIVAPLNRPDTRLGVISGSRLTDWDSRTPLPGEGGATDPNRKFRANDWFWQGSVRGDWDVSDQVTLTSITAYMKSRVRALREQDGIGTALQNFSTTISTGRVLTQAAGVDINDVASTVNAKTETFSQELRLSAHFGPINWVFGGNYLRENTSEFNFLFLQNFGLLKGVPAGGYDDASYSNNQRVKSFGVFTHVDVELTRQLTLAAGIRLSQEIRRFNGCTNAVGNQAASTNATINQQRAARGLPPLSGDQLITQGECTTIDADFVPREGKGLLKQNNVPWDVTLNFKPADRTLIYGRVARGYKSGNFPSFSASSNSSYSPVRQESVTAYELGFKASLSRLLSLEGAVFRYDYANKQQRGREDTGQPFGLVARQVNIPQARIDGAELSWTLRPVKGFTIGASGTYLKSKVIRYAGFNADGVNVNAAGAPLNFNPKYSANVDVNYTFPVTDRLEVFAGGNVAYRSKQVAQIASADRWKIDPYTLFDAQLGVSGNDGQWRVWAFGKNLTGKYYWTNVIKTSDLVLRFPGMPATYGVAAAFKFR